MIFPLFVQDYYLQALESDPNNSEALWDYGNFLAQVVHDDVYAELFYLRLTTNTAQGVDEADIDLTRKKHKHTQWWSSVAKIQ